MAFSDWLKLWAVVLFSGLYGLGFPQDSIQCVIRSGPGNPSAKWLDTYTSLDKAEGVAAEVATLSAQDLEDMSGQWQITIAGWTDPNDNQCIVSYSYTDTANIIYFLSGRTPPLNYYVTGNCSINSAYNYFDVSQSTANQGLAGDPIVSGPTSTNAIFMPIWQLQSNGTYTAVDYITNSTAWNTWAKYVGPQILSPRTSRTPALTRRSASAAW